MNIGFLCPSVSRAVGGIFEIERRLAQSLSALPQTTVHIFAPIDEYTEADLSLWEPLCPQCFAFRGPASFRYSSGLRDTFVETRFDVAHLHALWMYNSIIMRQWVRRHKQPYMISVNGMLDPWAVQNAHWKKRIALRFYERKCLNQAACIQVNSESELESVRSFGLKNPIAVIPNGVDIPDNLMIQAASRNVPWDGLIASGQKVLLYLGRIHPKKGLVNLLHAWSRFQSDKSLGIGGLHSPRREFEWVLAIAGWDQSGHEEELKLLANELGLSWIEARSWKLNDKGQNSVMFLGPQFNEAKAACYQNSDAFILPSFSEGLPMVVLEAWAYGKPVLMTPQCNLPEGFVSNAAIRIESDIESITAGLAELFRLSDSDLRAIGNNGRHLAATRFTWAQVADDMRAVYEWMLGDGPGPDCVVR